jgi:hypothetical protein
VIAALTPPAMLREKLALPRVRQLVNDEIFAELAFSLRKNKCATPSRATWRLPKIKHPRRLRRGVYAIGVSPKPVFT